MALPIDLKVFIQLLAGDRFEANSGKITVKSYPEQRNNIYRFIIIHRAEKEIREQKRKC
jgi:hypothetical protein